MGRILRTAASVLLLAASLCVVLFFIEIPTYVSAFSAPKNRPAAMKPLYHALDRAVLETIEPGYCETCHSLAPHYLNRELRGFLNLHCRAMDCGACHLQGGGGEVRRFRGDVEVTDKSLVDGGPLGRIYFARKDKNGFTRVEAPGSGIVLKPQGVGCKECHQRGSRFFDIGGLYDPYRVRILEDLKIFHRMRLNSIE